MNDFFAECGFAVTVCDLNATIVYMNNKACKVFEKFGGKSLIGQSLYSCHQESSKEKIRSFMATGHTNAYTIEKNGVKKMIHQSPWFDESGKLAGLVELSIELPAEMPHFVRKP